jgi:hypothetical protein
MTVKIPSGNGETDQLQEGIHECVIFAAPCFEKKDTLRGASFGIMLITPARMIITPLPSARVYPEIAITDGEMHPVKPVTPPGPARTRDSSRLEAF